MSGAQQTRPSNVTHLNRNVAQERYLSPSEVCELVPGMTVVNLQELRKRRVGPRYFKPTARTVVYAESDVRAWVQASAVNTRSGS